MKKSNEERTLTRAEMEIMKILWDNSDGMTTHEVIACYPEPKPAYTTISTFLKILTKKEFVSYRTKAETGKTFYYYPLVSRDEYTRRFMKEVKTTFFGGSLKSLISFFAKDEEISDDELREIVEMINNDLVL